MKRKNNIKNINNIEKNIEISKKSFKQNKVNLNKYKIKKINKL